MESSDDIAVVYWLHDDSWIDQGELVPNVHEDGWVGVTSRPYWRVMNKHRRNARFPTGFTFEPLLIGTRDYCYEVEKRLRPHSGIGWNVHPGGDRADAQHKRVEEGKHNLLGGEQQREVNIKRLANGSHHFLTTYVCPHCDRTAKGPSFKRHHFDNCKSLS